MDMDNLENQPPSPSQVQPAALQAQLDSLRQLVVSTLILLLVVSGTLNVFFLKQAKSARQDLEDINRAFGPAIRQNPAAGAWMDDFVRKLVGYAKDHPDFAPVLRKYVPQLPPTAPAPARPAAPPAKK